MYSKQNKNKFLDQFENKHTKKVYESIFNKTEEIEKLVGVDFMDFNLDMFNNFIVNYMKPKTKQSARTYGYMLSNYIQWSIDNNYSKSIENPISPSSYYFESFVKNQDSLYIRKSEIDAIIFSLINAQDAFIIKALFEGIQGKQLCELVNLKKKNIIEAQETGELTLNMGESSERRIKIEDDTLKLALIAMKEREYYKKNGEVDYLDNVKDRVDLADSDYVLRPSITNSAKEKLTHYSIYNRLEMIKELEDFEEYKDALTTKNIVRSGMLYEAKKMLDNGLELDRKALEYICSKYNISYKWSLKDFLNKDTVSEVYGL